MKNGERTVVIALVVVLLTVSGAMAQVMGPDAMMKGIEFTRAKVI